MELLAWTISIIASLLLMVSALAFLKSRDLYSMTHVIIISNCYIIPLLLIGLGVEKFSLISSAKILALILLNIIITNFLCYTILRKAFADKVKPQAEVKWKFNTLLFPFHCHSCVGRSPYIHITKTNWIPAYAVMAMESF